MAEIWKPKSIPIYLEWVDAVINEASEQLTDWESTFIESIQTRLLQNRNLTEAQEQTLERLYTENTK